MALTEFEARGQPREAGMAHAILLTCTAALGDWAGWRTHADEIAKLIRQTGFVCVDLALTTMWAGEQAQKAHRRGEARESYAIALAQWQALRRDSEVQKVEARLAALDSDAHDWPGDSRR